MEARTRRALIAAPLAAVGTVAGVLLGPIIVLAILIGQPLFAVLGVLWIGLLLAVFGVPTALVLTGALVGLARVTRTSLDAVSYRTVVIAAVLGSVLASYGLLWLVDNLADWWMPLCAAPAGAVGARTFVRRRARIADEPAAS
jgi:hypothetical protein